MSNILQAADNAYPYSNISPLLKAIKKELEQTPEWIQWDNDHLILTIEQIAQHIATKSDIPSPLQSSASVATAYAHDMTAQSDALYQLVRVIQEDVKRALERDDSSSLPLLIPLEKLRTKKENQKKKSDKKDQPLSLRYPFNDVVKQYRYMAQVVSESDQNAVLRLHRVTYTFQNSAAFRKNLDTALNEWCRQRLHNDEDVLATLEGEQSLEQSRYMRLLRLVDTETIGKLRRAIYPHCFAFLQSDTTNPSEGQKLCREMQQRLEYFEAFLHRTDKRDDYWQVRFGSWEGDLRDLFSSSDALDDLPIIPQLKDKIGETTDPTKKRKEYLWSLSFKLNGPVHRDPKSPTSFQYHIDHYINPEGDGFRQKVAETSPDRLPFFYSEVIQRAVLYTFCFQPFYTTKEPSSSSDSQRAVEELLVVLRKGTDINQEKRDCLKSIANLLRGVEGQINQLAKWIQERSRVDHAPAPKNINLQMVVHTSLLHQDIDTILGESSLFRDVLGEERGFGIKPALRHISVMPSGPVDGELVKLDVQVRLDCLHTVNPGEPEETKSRTVSEEIIALPVLFYPQKLDYQKNEIYDNLLTSHPWICVPFSLAYLDDRKITREQSFRYRFTWLLLAYYSLVALADHLAPATETCELFLPLLRLHFPLQRTNEKQNGFLRNLSHAVAHTLGNDYRASAQGFQLNTTGDLYRAQNATRSLYAALPHRFKLLQPVEQPAIPKAALLVVSSRVCDRLRNSQEYRTLVAGTVTTFTRPNPETIEVNTKKHFAETMSTSKVWVEPTVVIDTIRRLYTEGYRHIIYIANAPYTSTLNLTSDPDEELFFFATPILHAMMKDAPGLHIYPLFQSLYAASMLPKYHTKLSQKSHALCTQELAGLSQLLSDPARQVVVAYQLSNAQQISPGAFYSHVCSYAVPLNMHPDVLSSTDLQSALLADHVNGEPNRLKAELFQMLTLFHFTHNEAHPRGKEKAIYPKLNPYKRLIGDESVLKESMFEHSKKFTKFNGLALLTEARAALRRKTLASKVPPSEHES